MTRTCVGRSTPMNFQAIAVGCFVTQSPPYQAMGRTSTSKSRTSAASLRSSRTVAPKDIVEAGANLQELAIGQRLVELVERVGQDGVNLLVRRQGVLQSNQRACRLGDLGALHLGRCFLPCHFVPPSLQCAGASARCGRA